MTSLFSRTLGRIVYFREIIPKWPQDVRLGTYDDFLRYIELVHAGLSNQQTAN